MGILALAQIALADNMSPTEYGDVRSANRGVVLLDGEPERLTFHLHLHRLLRRMSGVDDDLQIVPHVSAAAVEQHDDRSKDSIEKRLEARHELSDASIGGEAQRSKETR